MQYLDEKQFEEILSSLPRPERSQKADAAFYEKLEALAAHKSTQETDRVAEKTTVFEKPRLHFWSFPRFAFAGSFAALLIVFAGTLLAYQASTVRGDILYGWKRAGEKIEIAFAFSADKEIDAHLRFADRRMEEAESLVSLHPSLAWIFDTAFADESAVDLNLEEARNLEFTFADMHGHIKDASRIIEEKISAPEKVEKILEKIEAHTDKHIEKLAALEKRGKRFAKEIIQKAAATEDEYIAAVVEARETAKAAIALKQKIIKIKLALPEETDGIAAKSEKTAAAADRKKAASAEVMEITKLYGKLLPEERKIFEEKIETAREAMQNEKFGKAKGLSRALKQNLLDEIADKKDSYIPGPGFKPGSTMPVRNNSQLEDKTMQFEKPANQPPEKNTYDEQKQRFIRKNYPRTDNWVK